MVDGMLLLTFTHHENIKIITKRYIDYNDIAKDNKK